MSIDSRRPKPIFQIGGLQFSTKKEKLVNRLRKSAPKPIPRSLPVPRIVSHYSRYTPRPVSFLANDTFIIDSQSYNSGKEKSYFEQCYTIEGKLGSGSFGEVNQVRCKDNGKVYACKKMFMKFRGEMDRLQRIEEVRKLQQLPRHSNCIKFYHAWEENLHLFLLTEVCKTTLSDIILNDHLNENQMWSYIIDIAQGLNHLHTNKLIHMDLKPDNVFIGMDNLCKIGDFGLVIDFSKGYPKEAREGDPKYLAPECFKRIFTPAADMFSLGMTILELATDLDLPAQGPGWHTLRLGTLPPLAKEISSETHSLLLDLLNPDPLERLSCSELLSLPFIQKKMTNKRIYQSLQKGVSVVYRLLEYTFSWSHYVRTMINGFLSGLTWFKYKRKDELHDLTPKLDDSLSDVSYLSQNMSRTVSELPDFSSEEEGDSLCFPSPLVKSTPLSSYKRTQFQLNSLRWKNWMQEEVEKSKNSDLMTMDSFENEPERPLKTKEELTASILKTSRNLLNLFNSTEDSDDESS